jgi:hypothetical protein
MSTQYRRAMVVAVFDTRPVPGFGSCSCARRTCLASNLRYFLLANPQRGEIQGGHLDTKADLGHVSQSEMMGVTYSIVA